MKTTRQAEVDARLRKFWADHKDYDPQWVRNVLHNIPETLPFVFRWSAVSDGITRMYRGSGVKFPPGDKLLFGDDLPSQSLSVLPIFRRALQLRAFAYYGLELKYDDDDEDFGMDALLWAIERGRFPMTWAHDEEVETTIKAAMSRQILDHPKRDGGLEPDGLAALARVSRKSILNMLAPSRRNALQLVPARGTQGGDEPKRLITVESARRWLLSRHDFYPTISQEQDGATGSVEDAHTLFAGDPAFVPATGDGSWFSPGDYSLSSGTRSYSVGDGREERSFPEYWDALDWLLRAPAQHWRWRDALGRWRTKAGTEWIRKSRQELQSLIDEDDAPSRSAENRRKR